ncbi:hypothetical protein A2W14_05440 [Candidatus Gottesmanbacteria bacterium RBG_16_37_8]|uniref:Uncharacterized protein n=1 Tax=Candidatus Gottesmanbacteria bacterium RBG_16_37_8 TaxID=1798371 RepID=A0A1F5YV92_9BACT|nr:MAG: hypothetical protein A2W14_05440 [Candidatus Gottesmanbacteria bacterium RBG_16_37_8]
MAGTSFEPPPGAGGPPPAPLPEGLKPPGDQGKPPKKEQDMVPLSELQKLQKALENAQKEIADLKVAQVALKKEPPKEKEEKPAGKTADQRAEDAFDTERRIPLQTTISGVLGKTMKKFLGERVEPGPQAALGYGTEIRRPGWLRRTLLKIPFLGFLAPEGMSVLPAAASKIATIGQAAQVGGEILAASVTPALTVGVLGALTRGSVDGIRWAVMKEKTMHLFARELVRRGTDGGRNWDSGAIWNTVFGDKADVAQLLDLNNELKAGTTANNLMMDKGEMRRLIKRGFGSKLEKLTLERIVSQEGLAKLTPAERLYLQDVDTAYDVAEKLFSQGLSPVERAAFLQDELPHYLQKREVTNHLKAMGKRSVIAGFKTSLVGMATSIFGTLTKTGLLADWGSRGEHIVKEGVTSVQQISNTWFDLAKKNFGYYANKLSYKLSALAAGP